MYDANKNNEELNKKSTLIPTTRERSHWKQNVLYFE